MFTFAIDRGAFATFGWEDANEAGRSKSVDLERVPELRMCAALTSYPHERWGVVRAPFFALRPASYRRWPLLPPHRPASRRQWRRQPRLSLRLLRRRCWSALNAFSLRILINY
jgi:hypothetical protein